MDKKKILIGGGILATLIIAIMYYSKKSKNIPTPTPSPITNPTNEDCTGGVKNDKGVCVFPKKYIFTQDYSARVPTLNPTQPENPNKEFKAGDIINGYLNTEIFPSDLGNAEPVVVVVTKIDGSVPDIGIMGQVWLNIPIEVLGETAGPRTFANYVDTKKNQFFQPDYNKKW